jgi:glycosyltransferase involved in cell wall biosynthesis
MKRLTIVQPYVPEYRVPFFEGLAEVLAADGVRCTVAAGSPDAVQAQRGDEVDRDWIVRIPNRRIRLGSRTASLGGARGSWKGADAVILGLLGSSLDNYRAIAESRRTSLRVGLWGHIDSYVNDPHPLDAALERWQLRRADHIFAYTPGGAEFARKLGIGSSRITTVMNTTSTTQLRLARDSMTAEAIGVFRTANGLAGRPTLAYIGGLDRSKRVDFLAATLDAMWELDPMVRVVVAGNGEHAALLESAEARGQVVRVGYADEHLKALIGRSASAFLNPGRIGLTAVDTLALGRPLLTTGWAYHAPEAEYLIDGVSRVTAVDDPEQYAKVAVQLSHVQKAPEDWQYPTLDAMIENFACGVRRLLNMD